LHVKVTVQGQGHFSEGSRSLGKVKSYAVADSEISDCFVVNYEHLYGAVGRVRPVYLMNADRRQAAANPQTKPIDLLL